MKHFDLAHFPMAPGWVQRSYDFNSIDDVSAFNQRVAGHTATSATTTGHGGLFILGSGSASSGDENLCQEKSEQLLLTQGIQVYTSIIWEASDASLMDLFVGWTPNQAITYWGNSWTDLVGLLKVSGETAYRAVAGINNSVYASLPYAPALVTEDANKNVLSFSIVMDPVTAGKGTITTWFNGEQKSQVVMTTIPYDEALCLTFGFQQGEAVAKTLEVDWVGYAYTRSDRTQLGLGAAGTDRGLAYAEVY